jgi:hypothetical protein
MTPELRAIADRFIYEQATLKHMMALVPEGGYERPVPGLDWTVRQLFGHLAKTLTTYSEAVRTWLDGQDPTAGDDTKRRNDETAAGFSKAPAEEIAALFGSGLNDLVATLAKVPEERTEVAFGPKKFIEASSEWSEHFLSHAVALVRALPEVRMDPLVLNWLLYANFDDDKRRQWQEELLVEARAYIATLSNDEEDEE